MKRAFTLAETLIVMGIIGVVAALTLPNLNSSTANKEKVVKLQKIYSNLQDAFGRATAVYGPTDEWCTGLELSACQKRYFERVTEFMKFSKQCTVSDNCSLRFNTGSTSEGNPMTYGVILADGATIDISASTNVNSGTATIMIDLDGVNKGANKACYDYFNLQYRPERGVYYKKNNNGDIISNCSDCTAWVLENGNMDYLKCSGLKFGTNTTCK